MQNNNTSSKDFEFMLSAMPYLCVCKDNNGIYLDCSDAFVKKLGYNSKADIIGKNDVQLAWMPNSEQTNNTATTHQYNETLLTKSGDLIHLSATTNPMLDDEGNVVKTFVFYEEISQPESNLLTEQYFENIFNCVPANIYWKDKNSVIVGCNNRWAMTAGFDNEAEAIGKTDADLPWSDQAKRIRNNEIEIMRSGLSRIFEEVSENPDGSLTYFLTTKSPLYDHKGEIAGTVGISVDITDRKLAEQALSEAQKNLELQKAYLDNIISHLPANVYWKDTDCVIIGCNDSHAECTGLGSCENVIGKTDYDLPWGDQADAVIQNDKEVMSTGITQTFEETGKLLDGTMAVFLTIKAPLRDSSQKIIGLLGISINITERKAVEAALVEAKQKAEIATQLKSDFIENMQHDLRTPSLGVWTALTDLVKAETDKTKQINLQLIEKSAKQLFKLCTEVTDFDKVERNEHEVIFKNIHLHKIVDNVIELYDTAASKKGLKLISTIDAQVPNYIRTDNYRIQRILINLIGNAIKFTSSGEVRLKVSSEMQNKNEVKLTFQISDTGIGICQENLNYLYEGFSRGTPSNQGNYKGSGLGLKVVKRFVEELNGDIDVESEPGHGTQITVTLSAELASSKDCAEPLDNIDASSISDDIETIPCEQQNISTLLIEDDMLARIAAESTLKSLGCEVTSASSVHEAIDLLDHKKFMLVVSDIGLPDGTGYDIAKHVKLEDINNINHDTPFFALTAHSGKNKDQEAKNAGFIAMLTKPLVANQFAKLMGNHTKH